MPPVIKSDLCTSGGYCAEFCPVDVLKLIYIAGVKTLTVRCLDECWHCRACVNDCPVGALSIRYSLSHMLLTFEPDKKEM